MATNGPECQSFLQRLSDLPEGKAQIKRAGANERNENWTRDSRGSDSDGHRDTAMDGRSRGGLQVFPTDGRSVHQICRGTTTARSGGKFNPSCLSTRVGVSRPRNAINSTNRQRS